jgi:hypothetical protein
MSRFELDDNSFEHLRRQGGESQPPVNSFVSEHQAPQPRGFPELFTEDFQDFTRYQEPLLKEITVPCLSVESMFVTAVERHPFDYEFMKYATLKQLGYPYYLSDDAEPRWGSPFHSIRVGRDATWVDDTETGGDRPLMLISNPLPHHPLDQFLAAVCSLGRNTSALRTGVIAHFDDSTTVLLPNFAGEERQRLLAKGLLTAMLFHISQLHYATPEDKQAYVNFRQQGFTPFNGEQLYGMMESVVRHNLN